ncbi:nucleic acid-binding, OB-fold protein [Artemisia annua]|uniref:Nucleic acid-binding, OB-fold protein n=1 Tax=Artemisia annua TaxID=35608 RepID=A0A2U1N123_ARTAN|nr:nucleic acid-binding, OB-fold protein [Artemisia annua]
MATPLFCSCANDKSKRVSFGSDFRLMGSSFLVPVQMYLAWEACGSTGAVPGPMNEAQPIIPMVLDFSVACILHAHAFVGCLFSSSDGDAIPTERPTFATRSRRARNTYIVYGKAACTSKSATYVHRCNTRSAHSADYRRWYVLRPSQSMNVGNPPMQGPIGPPQREGPPTDYRSFGGCDQVCQHCRAMFWIEEKRTGLPASAAPQYQRCCAGGRLTSDVGAASKAVVQPAIPQRTLGYFTDLNPADNTKFIEVRVYRKWIATKVPSLIATGFSCILLNKKGSAIQANADLKEKDRFEHDLQLNCVYRIEGFGFEKTDSWGKTLDNDFTLCFGKHTRTDLLTDNDFLYHYFNFAAYNELGGRLEKNNPILTGQLQLSATAATSYYFNPPIEETFELLAAYSFRIIITDGTGNATMTCFTPQTDGLIKPVDTLLQEIDNKDPAVIPPQILALQNTRHVFQFRFAKQAGKGTPTLVLQKVMDNPPTILLAPTEGPSSPPAPSPSRHASAETSPPPVTPVATQDSPADTCSTAHAATTSTVRRELFTGTAATEDHPKVNKTEAVDKEDRLEAKKQKTE